MTPEDANALVRRRFTYTPEARERWNFPPDTGRIRDDCDGYAIAVIYFACGALRWRFWWALARREYRIWHVKTASGAGHAVLEHAGLYTDNIVKDWSPRAHFERRGHRFLYRRSLLGVALKFLRGWRR